MLIEGKKLDFDYNGIIYNISFHTINTRDMVINYIYINGYDTDCRIYKENVEIQELNEHIKRAITVYNKNTKQ